MERVGKAEVLWPCPQLSCLLHNIILWRPEDARLLVHRSFSLKGSCAFLLFPAVDWESEPPQGRLPLNLFSLGQHSRTVAGRGPALLLNGLSGQWPCSGQTCRIPFMFQCVWCDLLCKRWWVFPMGTVPAGRCEDTSA